MDHGKNFFIRDHMTDRNPQAAQMSAESMVRTLSAQVRCIWPQESLLFDRYGSPRQILDVGCGSGEFTPRLAERYPHAEVLGIEIDPAHVQRARLRCAEFGQRIRFEVGDAFNLQVPDGTADLVVCRHVLQALPEPERVVAECHRALRREGWIHLLVEDYTMIHIDGPPSFDRFWIDGPVQYAIETGCDARIGRRGLSLISDFRRSRLDYVSVDTVRVERADFVAVMEAWRDGYAEVLAQYIGCTVAESTATMNAMIEAIRTGYAIWQVPIASGQRS